MSIVKAQHEAGAAMMHQLLTSEPANTNCFVSPLSIFCCLSMALAGSAGETLAEMRRTLALAERGDAEDVLTAAAKMLGGFKGDGTAVEIEAANSIWGNNFRPEFVRLMTEAFRAEARPQTGAGPINDWVRERTKGLIQNILAPGYPLSPTDVVLVNAVYFKGTWLKPFDPQATVRGPWRGPNGGACDLMHLKDTFAYAQEPGSFELVELPYGEKGLYHAVVVLPAPEADPRAFASTALVKALATKGMGGHKGTVVLPRFKIESSFSLKEPLKRMGMNRSFDAGAEFPKIATVPLLVQDVFHKVYIEVDEKGTKAAAATAMVLCRSGVPKQEFNFVADRPFYFAILHSASHALLFLGLVSQP